MTDRLRNDVIFVNVDGCSDFSGFSVYDIVSDGVKRLNRIDSVHNHLTDLGLKSYRLNPINGDIMYIPFFHTQSIAGIVSYSTFILFELYTKLIHQLQPI